MCILLLFFSFLFFRCVHFIARFYLSYVKCMPNYGFCTQSARATAFPAPIYRYKLLSIAHDISKYFGFCLENRTQFTPKMFHHWSMCVLTVVVVVSVAPILNDCFCCGKASQLVYVVCCCVFTWVTLCLSKNLSKLLLNRTNNNNKIWRSVKWHGIQDVCRILFQYLRLSRHRYIYSCNSAIYSNQHH